MELDCLLLRKMSFIKSKEFGKKINCKVLQGIIKVQLFLKGILKEILDQEKEF